MAASLSAVRSAAPYEGWLREAIVKFKYEDEPARADHLGELLLPLLGDLATDALVPVPLHARRARRRGYNQSNLLARRLRTFSGIALLDGLIRVRETAPQVGLGGRDRRLNVAGAFDVRGDADVAGMRLTLVDDVLTTGSTLGACADALVAGGAVEVSALTVARQTPGGAESQGVLANEAAPSGGVIARGTPCGS